MDKFFLFYFWNFIFLAKSIEFLCVFSFEWMKKNKYCCKENEKKFETFTQEFSERYHAIDNGAIYPLAYSNNHKNLISILVKFFFVEISFSIGNSIYRGWENPKFHIWKGKNTMPLKNFVTSSVCKSEKCIICIWLLQ